MIIIREEGKLPRVGDIILEFTLDYLRFVKGTEKYGLKFVLSPSDYIEQNGTSASFMVFHTKHYTEIQYRDEHAIYYIDLIGNEYDNFVKMILDESKRRHIYTWERFEMF